MKDDALIPLKLFRSSTFSMATVIGVFVGFGMFGAMLTLPLYLQLVLGSTPTESGFQMLPMILGLMIASIGSGQIIARTGRYRIFPVLGTALMSLGFFWLTFLQYDGSFWFIAGAMLVLGLGLGPAHADPHDREPELRRHPRHGCGDQLVDVLPPDRRHARHGSAALAAVHRAARRTCRPRSPTPRRSPARSMPRSTPRSPTLPRTRRSWIRSTARWSRSSPTATTTQIEDGLTQAADAATQAVADKVAAGEIPAAAQEAADDRRRRAGAGRRGDADRAGDPGRADRGGRHRHARLLRRRGARGLRRDAWCRRSRTSSHPVAARRRWTARRWTTRRS